MQVPESYQGREQAFVKHQLLETYLMRLFMIIGLYQKNIRYVDCFSGPWQEESDELQDTSIGISIKIIQKCREGLKERGRDVTFHTLFIEKDKNSFQRLQEYLAGISLQGVSTKALPGDFFELRAAILEWCGQDDFTFFFIDPKGWKNVVEIPTLTPLLQRSNSEFLINFMYDFLLRTHSQNSFKGDMQAIFGEIPETDGLTPEKKEEHLLKLYRQGLKEIVPARGGKPRTVSVPVLKPTIDRTLYHLVYLTQHPRGITVFMEASESLDLVQRRIRAQVKQKKRESRSHQLELFQSVDGVHAKKHVDHSVVKSYWLKMLSNIPRQFGVEELADMLEETGWFESDFQAAFGDLEKAGKVQNLDATGRRRTKFVHFTDNHNKGECLIKVIS
jgi:three-Cys-motif partner protein